MKKVRLIEYSVRGIKSLDQMVELSFYKKTLDAGLDMRGYNVKGIYGANGAGKSAIITSVRILKRLIINSGYLSDPLTQRQLSALINKSIGQIDIRAKFAADNPDGIQLYEFSITMVRDADGNCVIDEEQLRVKKGSSRRDTYTEVYCVENGKVTFPEKNDLTQELTEKTQNLLSVSTLASQFYKWLRALPLEKKSAAPLFDLLLFGLSINTYMDTEDDHLAFFLIDTAFSDDGAIDAGYLAEVLRSRREQMFNEIPAMGTETISVAKDAMESFLAEIKKLARFVRIFKPDLQGISVDSRESRNGFECRLIMEYDGYRVDAEFESTGVKKLIRLFTYIQRMVGGEIVFIDEFDSNLHDVYLCALLEYLMENGQGQLCFTTHNIGPMDVLKNNKKSIDFLSADRRIVSWANNGNYSPSRLYRNGMIEGSPFNVDSIDFIGVFGG